MISSAPLSKILDVHIIETLTFLDVPDLLRFRLVSRKHNKLIMKHIDFLLGNLEFWKIDIRFMRMTSMDIMPLELDKPTYYWSRIKRATSLSTNPQSGQLPIPFQSVDCKLFKTTHPVVYNVVMLYENTPRVVLNTIKRCTPHSAVLCIRDDFFIDHTHHDIAHIFHETLRFENGLSAFTQDSPEEDERVSIHSHKA